MTQLPAAVLSDALIWLQGREVASLHVHLIHNGVTIEVSNSSLDVGTFLQFSIRFLSPRSPAEVGTTHKRNQGEKLTLTTDDLSSSDEGLEVVSSNSTLK